MGYGRLLCTVLIAVLALAAVSSAKYETVTTGPYRVSFHLNTTEQYDVGVEKAKYGETYGGVRYISYGIRLNNSYKVNRALIDVTFHNRFMYKSVADCKQSIEAFLMGTHHAYIRTYERIINRQLGALGTGIDSDGDILFVATYWPAFNVSGDTRVSMCSYYPWEDGTLDLLKTIHVEMVGSPPPL